jgi:hypothetical protein
MASGFSDRGFLILAVNNGEPLATVQTYQNQYANLLFLVDPNSSAFNLYKKPGGSIPLNYLIDHDMQQTINYSMEGFNLFLFQSRVIALLSDVGLLLAADSSAYQPGTMLGFDLDYKNWKSSQNVFFRLIDVKLPSGSYFSLYPPVQITLGPNEIRNVRYDFPLPALAPLGNYVLRVRAGQPGDLWNADFCMFEIIP